MEEEKAASEGAPTAVDSETDKAAVRRQTAAKPLTLKEDREAVADARPITVCREDDDHRSESVGRTRRPEGIYLIVWRAVVLLEPKNTGLGLVSVANVARRWMF